MITTIRGSSDAAQLTLVSADGTKSAKAVSPFDRTISTAGDAATMATPDAVGSAAYVVQSALAERRAGGVRGSILGRVSMGLNDAERADLDCDLAIVRAAKDPLVAAMLSQFSEQFVGSVARQLPNGARQLLSAAAEQSPAMAFDIARAMVNPLKSPA